MSKPSTANFVPYGLRPSKQTERRILLDFLKCANEGGLTISDSRYVGMGGVLFYDFHLMHRFAGINNMISLGNKKTSYSWFFYSLNTLQMMKCREI